MTSAMTALRLLSIIAFTQAGWCETPAASSTSRGDRKPNIILIMADDLGYGSLACYGHRKIRTPHIDALASTGVRLTDFHSNGAYCSPTRAALMTGRYQQRCAWVADEDLSPVFRAQRHENQKQRWAWGISPNELTIPSLLQQSGYRTALIGKWHLGYDEKFHPMNYGFDEFRGFIGGNVDYHTHVAGYGLKQLDWWKDRKLENENGYTTDLLTQASLDFITRHKDKPFFLFVAQAAPHAPWQGRDATAQQSPAKTYQEMIEILDESVGRITESLRHHHLESNTIVIFCSDNGAAAPHNFSANGSLKGNKGSFLEGGHRVPCIVRWSGVIPAGSTQDGTMMTMDFLPTFAKIAGAEIPANHIIDGQDLLPMLQGKQAAPQRVLHWHSDNTWAIRRGSWKLQGIGDRATMLVNLDTMGKEEFNHIQENPEIRDQLLKLHLNWLAEVGEK